MLDKTGTITQGKPVVTDTSSILDLIPNSPGVIAPLTLWRSIGALESNSEHPLAEALLQYARERSKDSQLPTVERFEAIAGSGVKGIVEGREVWIGTQRWFDEMGLDSSAVQAEQQALENAGKTVVFAAVDGHLQAAIAVADTVKPNSAKAIQTLQRMGIEVVMLTGDNQRTAKAIAVGVAYRR